MHRRTRFVELKKAAPFFPISRFAYPVASNCRASDLSIYEQRTVARGEKVGPRLRYRRNERFVALEKMNHSYCYNFLRLFGKKRLQFNPGSVSSRFPKDAALTAACVFTAFAGCARALTRLDRRRWLNVDCERRLNCGSRERNST